MILARARVCVSQILNVHFAIQGFPSSRSLGEAYHTPIAVVVPQVERFK